MWTLPMLYDIAWSVGVVSVIALDVLALIHLAKHRRTTSDWVWVLVIVGLPLLGVLLYSLLGPRRCRNENPVRDTSRSGPVDDKAMAPPENSSPPQ